MVVRFVLSRRAVAAGVMSSARTKILPMVLTEMTTAAVTHRYKMMSKTKTGKPIARAVSRSKHVALSWGPKAITMATTTAHTQPATIISVRETPVSEPKRKLVSEAL